MEQNYVDGVSLVIAGRRVVVGSTDFRSGAVRISGVALYSYAKAYVWR